MKQFIFNTTATMKDYNSEKWWIERDIVKSMQVEAKDLREALNEYREIIAEKYYIDISNNAIKNKNAMYIDLANGESKQIGYVITGKTDFQNDAGKWTSQYIDLWIDIVSVVDTVFS